MTPERVEKIYDELETLVIVLDPDPAARGTAYLQDLISKTRGYLNHTSNLLGEVNRYRHRIERDLDAHEAAYEISSSDLLASDHRVTRLPNIDDRKAMISLLLREEKKKILDLKREVKELGFVDKAVRHRHKELDNTMSAIRMQKSLIDTEMRTGAYYGDETDTARGQKSFTASDIDETELATLLSDVMAESPAQAPSEPAHLESQIAIDDDPQPVVETTIPEHNPELASIEKFLSGDDYDDIFNELNNS